MADRKLGTKFPGVRARLHNTRKHGVRFDECYFIRFRVGGKLVEEQVGWLSQGKTAEKAYLILSQLKDNARAGRGPRTLAELRLQNQQIELTERAKAVSFEDYFSDYYLPEARQRKRDKTISVEQAHCRDWINPVLCGKPMKDIHGGDLEQIKDRLLSTAHSPRTVQHCLAIFRLIWNHARKRGIITFDCPTANIDMPRVNNARSRFLTPEEASRLLEAVKQLDEHAWELTVAALYTGARLGELTSLSWAGVDLTQGTMRLTHTKTNVPRIIPLAKPLLAVLRTKPTAHPGDPVFTNREGKRWKEQPWAFRHAIKKLGLNEGRADRRDRIVFHSLRHTSASLMLAAGVDIKSLQSLFGWSTLQMAERYTHAISEVKNRAIQTLENALEVRKECKVVPLNRAQF